MLSASARVIYTFRCYSIVRKKNEAYRIQYCIYYYLISIASNHAPSLFSQHFMYTDVNSQFILYKSSWTISSYFINLRELLVHTLLIYGGTGYLLVTSRLVWTITYFVIDAHKFILRSSQLTSPIDSIQLRVNIYIS